MPLPPSSSAPRADHESALRFYVATRTMRFHYIFDRRLRRVGTCPMQDSLLSKKERFSSFLQFYLYYTTRIIYIFLSTYFILFYFSRNKVNPPKTAALFVCMTKISPSFFGGGGENDKISAFVEEQKSIDQSAR